MIGWVKKLHEAIYREEQPLKYDIAQKKEDSMAINNLPNLSSLNSISYQQSLGQQAGTGQLGYTNSVQTSAVPLGGWAQAAVYLPPGQNHSITLPQPTGNQFTISFRDASGIIYPMVIDQAYAVIMQQISHMQQFVPSGVPVPWPLSSPSPPAPSKMVDGEFSLDEMGQAEEIIMELDGAN